MDENSLIAKNKENKRKFVFILRLSYSKGYVAHSYKKLIIYFF